MFILSDVYRILVGTGERVLSPSMKKLVKWDHPGKGIVEISSIYSMLILAGPKYVHFWSRKSYFYVYLFRIVFQLL